jgi:hypothetical protein
MTATVRKAYTLYRFWNSQGALLYVGMTGDPGTRWKHHSKGKAWWSDVDRVTVEHFESERELRDAETLAIVAETPRHNVAQTPLFRAATTSETTIRRSPATEDEDDLAVRYRDVNVLGAPVPPGVWGVNRSKYDDGVSAVVVVIEPCVDTFFKRVFSHIPISEERAQELLYRKDLRAQAS